VVPGSPDPRRSGGTADGRRGHRPERAAGGV